MLLWSGYPAAAQTIKWDEIYVDALQRNVGLMQQGMQSVGKIPAVEGLIT